MRALLGFLVIGGIATAQPAATSMGRVAGQVVSTTGDPVAKAMVRLQAVLPPPADSVDRAAGKGQAYIETTAVNGSFTFENLPFGAYDAVVTKPGFAYSTASRSNPNLLRVDGTPLNPRYVLTPFASISGRVVDRDGDPVTAQVQVLHYTYSLNAPRLEMITNPSSDDRGQFHVPNLAAGLYFLRFQPSTLPRAILSPDDILGPSAQNSNLTTYYPDSISLDGAMPIHLQTGADVTGIEVRMVRGTAVNLKGKVVDANGVPIAAQLTLLDVGERLTMNFTQPSATAKLPDGSFQFTNLAPGDYTLIGEMPQFPNGRNAPVAPPNPVYARFMVNIRPGMPELVVRMLPGVTVSGHVTLDGKSTFGAPPRVTNQPSGPPLSQRTPGSIAMMSTGAPPKTIEAVVQPDGSFTIVNVPPWQYRIVDWTLVAPRSYVSSVRMGAKDLTGQYLDFRAVPSGPLEIALSTKSGQINGSALDPKGNLLENVYVAIWSKQARLGDWTGSPLLRTVRGNAGGFKENLPPGDYFIASFDDFDNNRRLLPDPAFLAKFNSFATPFKVEEGSSQTVEPKWIDTATSEKVAQHFPD